MNLFDWNSCSQFFLKAKFEACLLINKGPYFLKKNQWKI